MDKAADQAGPAAAKLKRLRERAGYSVRELADLMGKAHSTYADYERVYKKEWLPMSLVEPLVPLLIGRGLPPIEAGEVLSLAGNLARFYGKGRGPQPSPNVDGEIGPPPMEYELAPTRREILSQQPVPPGYVAVREYAADGAAGSGREPVLNWQGQAQVLAEWIIPRDFLPAEHRNATIAVVRVQGDSMAPSLQPHDRVMVDVSHDWLGPDGVYMAWNGLGVVFKRLQAIPGKPPKVRFTSDNPAYEPYTLPAEEVNIIGRVIGKWTWW